MTSPRTATPQGQPVTITELLTEYGEEKIRYQVLSGSLEGSQNTRKDGTTRLSFRTEMPLTDVVQERVEGFLIWLDRAEMIAAMDRCKARRTLSVLPHDPKETK